MSTDRRALIVWGGWEGHEPEKVARIFERVLQQNQFEVEVSDTLDAFLDAEKLKQLSLIVPVVTMSTITLEQVQPLVEAVESGVGIGGCHGGMGDSFRASTEYQFMVGGQFVAHPGNDGLVHNVTIKDRDHEITRGVENFEVATEQYYMHVDPAINVLATTRFPVAPGPHSPNGDVDMPVVWTKLYGAGRVFYCSLGHNSAVVEQPPVLEICTRGLLWAAR